MSTATPEGHETVLPPEVGPVRHGDELDFDRVADHLRAHIEGLDGPLEVQQFGLGAANLTYLFSFGSNRLVVRRPPFGLIAPGAHDMGREFRALSHLSPVFPPAPRPLLLCEDPEVMGAPFLAIEYREGVVIRGAIPPSMRHHHDVGRRIGHAAIDALAALHNLDPEAEGISSLGRGQRYLARQIEGWQARWDAVAPADDDGLMAEMGRVLASTQPETQRTTVLHNDFKIDNCQFDPDQPDRVRSMFDWDMATLGDPLADLGTVLNYWPDTADTPTDRPMLHDGMESFGLPSRAEVVARYAEATGLRTEQAPWYEAFACWKTTVILQQLANRYQRGETLDPRMATIGRDVPLQARRAARILGER